MNQEENIVKKQASGQFTEITAEQIALENEQIERFLKQNKNVITNPYREAERLKSDFEQNPKTVYFSFFPADDGVKKGVAFKKRPDKNILKTHAFTEKPGRLVEDQLDTFCKLNDVKEWRYV